MTNFSSSQWIKAPDGFGEVNPLFRREFSLTGAVESATLSITALGVYEASLNGVRVGDFVMAPGWTVYSERLQVQEYDVTGLLAADNTLDVLAGPGWCVGAVNFCGSTAPAKWSDSIAVLAELAITYKDGSVQAVGTDTDWQAAKSPILYSNIYNGETCDSRVIPSGFAPALAFEHGKDMLIPQEGEIIREIDRLPALSRIVTPKGERVIDFGQNMTGYVEFRVHGAPGDEVVISHAEVLDKDGNFYTDNLRGAKEEIRFICNGLEQVYHAKLSFQGFRYIRLDSWPGDADLAGFTAIAVHSDMKRTGRFECSNEMVNKLYSNIVWGQKGNYLDIPTDCPQRDERLGWTGDAEVFVKAGAYNYDIWRFFKKWLRDLAASQRADGSVPHVIPDAFDNNEGSSAAWADAAVICPWQIYMMYGDKEVLAEQFESMEKWISYIRKTGDSEFLWNTGGHFGDWLGLDTEEGEYIGATDKYMIATAYYAYSTSLFIKAGKILGKDMSGYEALHAGIRKAFNETYIIDGLPVTNTQTASVLPLYFDLVDDKAALAENLAGLIHANGDRLTTGFLGTPYLLHVLADNGYDELAYTLLLSEKYPSWLYPITKGATTMWEHWDGIKPDGSMWSADMNSFNHYAYGAVNDFLFGRVAGINPTEERPGFAHIRFAPLFDGRLEFVAASLETAYGTVEASWKKADGKVKYAISVPEGCTADVTLPGAVYEVGAGRFEYLV